MNILKLIRQKLGLTQVQLSEILEEGITKLSMAETSKRNLGLSTDLWCNAILYAINTLEEGIALPTTAKALSPALRSKATKLLQRKRYSLHRCQLALQKAEEELQMAYLIDAMDENTIAAQHWEHRANGFLSWKLILRKNKTSVNTKEEVWLDAFLKHEALTKEIDTLESWLKIPTL